MQQKWYLKGNVYIAVNAYIRKKESSKINNLNFHFQELEKMKLNSK